jgi:hypothetical protein
LINLPWIGRVVFAPDNFAGDSFFHANDP